MTQSQQFVRWRLGDAMDQGIISHSTCIALDVQNYYFFIPEVLSHNGEYKYNLFLQYAGE